MKLNLDVEVKRCSKCGEDKSTTDYYASQKASDKLQTWCKDCQKERGKEYGPVWAKANPGKKSKYSKKYYEQNKDMFRGKSRVGRLKTYGLSVEDYEQILKDQDYSCGICGIHESEHRTRLHVDHDHTTGEVRGLLCSNCNTSLGGFMDSTSNLEKAIIYLKERNN